MSTHIDVPCPQPPGSPRTDPDPLRAEVHVAQVDLGPTRPGVVTISAPEFGTIRFDLDGAWKEREPFPGEARDFDHGRRADALTMRRLTEEIEAIRAGSERIDAERRAAIDEAGRLRLELEIRSDHARQIVAALGRAEEQADAARAELDRRERAFASANRAHEQGLAALREESAAMRKQGEERFADLGRRFEAQRATLLGEIERLREDSETLRQEREDFLVRLGGAERERDLHAANVAALGQRIRDLESDLIASVGESDQARDEARRHSEDLILLRRELERTRGELRAASEQDGELRAQIRAHRVEAERRRQDHESECMESRRKLAALQAEIDARQEEWREWRGDLDEARRRFDRDLRRLREQDDRRRDEADLLRQERDDALRDVRRLVQDRESMDRAFGEIEASREEAEQQSRAEIARLTAGLAEADRRHESIASLNEELSGEVAGLRAELDRLRVGRGTPDQQHQDPATRLPGGAGGTEMTVVAGRWRVRSAETNGASTRAEGEWTDRQRPGSRGVDAEDNGPMEGGRARPGPLPARDVGASSLAPFHPGEPPSMAFPSDADLAFVRGQVELLGGLLGPGPSSRHVLVYQQRLAEFSRKIREASRLATDLVNEVERSRRLDEMQFHMYLLRRAEEIERPRP